MATIVSRGDECNEIECMYEKKRGCEEVAVAY